MAGGHLLVLVGPAGAGKTTLAHRSIARSPEDRGFSVSHTTRPIRSTETDGVDYWFVDRATFEALRDQDGFAEWAEVHGNLYGTSRNEIKRLHDQGRDVLFDIDIVGATNLWRQYPQETRLIFVLPPSWQVLVSRLQGRGSETEATLRRRLRTARTELQGLIASPAPWHVISNDDLGAAVVALEPLYAQAVPPATAVADQPGVQAFLREALADPRTA